LLSGKTPVAFGDDAVAEAVQALTSASGAPIKK
jgi:hypothetical protein